MSSGRVVDVVSWMVASGEDGSDGERGDRGVARAKLDRPTAWDHICSRVIHWGVGSVESKVVL
jgi:hypothetical protein